MDRVSHTNKFYLEAWETVRAGIELDGASNVMQAAFERMRSSNPQLLHDILQTGIEFGEQSSLRRALLDAHMIEAAIQQTAADLASWELELGRSLSTPDI